MSLDIILLEKSEKARKKNNPQKCYNLLDQLIDQHAHSEPNELKEALATFLSTMATEDELEIKENQVTHLQLAAYYGSCKILEFFLSQESKNI